MGELTYTTAEIQERLDRVDKIGTLTNDIGTLSNLNTTAKDSIVNAVNELFISAREGKNGAVAVLAAHGVSVSATDTWDTISAAMDTWASEVESASQAELATRIKPLITNGDSITPTGSYASATYYNTSFGVKVSYTKGGDVIVTMKGGTNTNYENLIFTLSTSISGVSLAYGSETTWATAVAAGHLYSCVITGLTRNATMSMTMAATNATNDTVTCAITLTAA